MTDRVTTKRVSLDEMPVQFTDKAKKHLLEQANQQGKDRVKVGLVFGTNAAGKQVYKYNFELMEGPDYETELDEDLILVVDGNAVPAMRGSVIDLQEGINPNTGEKMLGFLVTNPNIQSKLKTLGGGCSGCPSQQEQGGCSTGGCSSEGDAEEE